jgi:hypothetical protein
MIKRADASKISREKATKEQIAENFKRLAVDTNKKVQLKPSLLKIQKTLDGNTFGIIHENKSYYLKYTTKKGSSNPTDFKHLDGLNATFGIEKFNSYDKAINKMTFICEAQNNVHKLKLLLEKEEDIIDGTEESTDSEETKSDEKSVTSDSTEDKLLNNLKKDKEASAAPEMGGDMGAADMSGDMAAAPETPVDTTKTGGESPAQMADEILPAIGDTGEAPAPEGGEEASAETPIDTTAAPEGGEELPAADAAPEGGEEAPAEEADPKKEFQEAVGKIGQTINDLQDKDQFDAKDIKNAMNSLISAIGPEGFKEVGDKAIESFYKKMQGSQESSSEEAPAEEAPVEEVPTEEPSTEKLDENFIKGLKTKAKVLLKEQLQQEIEKRKRNLLIQNIKRKLI